MKKITLAIIALICSILFAKAQSATAQYILKHIDITPKAMRFENAQIQIEDTATIVCSVVYNKNGGVIDVKVNQGIDELVDEDFRTAILLMPKGIFKPVGNAEKTYENLFFTLTFTPLSIEDARELELYFRTKRYLKINTQKPDVALRFPKIIEKYKSTDDVNSTLWIIRSRATNLRITTPKAVE